MKPAFPIAFALLAFSQPATAQDQPPTDTIEVTAYGEVDPLTPAERSVPRQLSSAQRQAYARVFRLIADGKIKAASDELSVAPHGVLHSTAQAQIMLAQGQNAGLTRLVDWLATNPDAPQAAAIAALARRAGATDLPQIATTSRMVPVRLTPGMGPRSANAQSTADQAFVTTARASVTAERPAEVETLLQSQWSLLSPDIRSEWAQRAAWMAYIGLDDELARRLGKQASDGQGEWAAMGHWVAGLAAFRQNDCEDSARHFDAIAKVYSADSNLRASGAYWAARSHVRCGRPHMVAERLKSAIARDRDGLYGLLSGYLLGMRPSFDWREPDFIQADWTTLKNRNGAKRAAALAELGENGLADRELRHLAASAGPDNYEPILRLAARLNLPATQYWLAQNPPSGRMPPMSARFPTPDWKPVRGWRVDKSLIFAHALQESRFITSARSPVGAKGLMQIMPGTARDLAKSLELAPSPEQLADPSFNVEFGQSYLEQLRDHSSTGGLLPKIIAAYNAGPGSVQRWNQGGLKDNGDALLFVESIPFRETRHYVEVVMRNLWLYQMKAIANDPDLKPALDASLGALASNRWPRFPAATPSAITR